MLVEEALAGLGLGADSPDASRDGFYVDATFGRGGHAARILQALGPAGRLLAIDRDPQAVAYGRQRFAADPRFVVVHAAFGTLETLVAAHGERRPVRGILFDLGVSSPQLDEAGRGFSFQSDGPLDMRMDPTRGESAAQWLSHASADEIRDGHTPPARHRARGAERNARGNAPVVRHDNRRRHTAELRCEPPAFVLPRIRGRRRRTPASRHGTASYTQYGNPLPRPASSGPMKTATVNSLA